MNSHAFSGSDRGTVQGWLKQFANLHVVSMSFSDVIYVRLIDSF